MSPSHCTLHTRQAPRQWQRVWLAALVVALSGGWPVLGGAQSVRRGESVTVRAGTALRGTPGGDVIGVSSRDVNATVESVQASFLRITIRGFVTPSDVRLTTDRTRGEVSPANGATLRMSEAAGSGAVAELRRGTYVFPTQGSAFPAARNATSLLARRSLWVDASRIALQPVTPPRLAQRPVAATASSSTVGPAGAARGADARTDQTAAARASVSESGPTLETRGPTSLQTGPGGDVLASVPGGVPLTTLARENGWVRVRLEGWMPDSSLNAAGTRSAGALTAADLRANPEGTVGRLVRWSVESLAFQTADDLRRGLTPGEPYLLARGPGAERAVLYLAIPDSLVARAQALPPLAEITITARVRNGRSQPSGVPVLDLVDLARR